MWNVRCRRLLVLQDDLDGRIRADVVDTPIGRVAVVGVFLCNQEDRITNIIYESPIVDGPK